MDTEDFVKQSVKYLHFPKDDQMDVYQVSDKKVQKWLINVISAFKDEKLGYPVLIHCRHGKDRTGIIIAAILHILGVHPDIIVQEFGKSVGIGDEEKKSIKLALDYFHKKGNTYWRGLDLKKIAANLRGG